MCIEIANAAADEIPSIKELFTQDKFCDAINSFTISIYAIM